MTTIVTRAGKGSPLTNTEVDTNFTNLNTAKIETLTSTDTSVTITGTGSTRDLSVPINPNSVSGPASSTDNAVARFDTTTGKLVQNSVVTVDDTGVMTGASINGASNTLSNIGNSALTNSAITINGNSTALGGSVSVGTVTSVTGTAPVVSSGGTTPAISMAAATSLVPGYLTASDWTTFNNKGSVTGVTGTSPIVSSGGTAPVISLADTSVTAGSYTNTNLTVDSKGRITSASSGSAASAGATVSTTTPSSPSVGNLWFNSNFGDTYVYYNDGTTNNWVSAEAGSSGIDFSSFDGGPALTIAWSTISTINGGGAT